MVVKYLEHKASNRITGKHCRYGRATVPPRLFSLSSFNDWQRSHRSRTVNRIVARGPKQGPRTREHPTSSAVGAAIHATEGNRHGQRDADTVLAYRQTGRFYLRLRALAEAADAIA